MKNARFAAAALFLLTMGFSAAALSQGNPDSPDGTWIGVEPEGMLPLGDFADVTSYGVGGTVYVSHGVAPGFALTGRTGFHFFGGKEVPYSTLLATGTQNIDITMIPVLGGVKYFFSQGDMRPYGGLEAGVFILSGSGEYTVTGGTAQPIEVDGETDVALVPEAGVQFRAGENMRVDARVNFSNVFTEGSSTSWITFGVGFEWGL